MGRLLSWFLAAVLAAHVLAVAPSLARAQFFDESLEQEELFSEDENAFFEDGSQGTEDTGGGAAQEPDFSEGNRFVDEQLVPADRRSLSQGGRRLQLTLGKERDVLPLNVAWGAGTGLLIGGWFALIAEGDNRSTQRSIGMGIVSGILLGVAVGTRSLFNPDAPRPALGEAKPPAKDGPQLTPLVALDPHAARVGFRLTF